MNLSEYVKGVVIIAVLLWLGLPYTGLPFSSCRWAGAPTRLDLSELIVEEWKNCPGYQESFERNFVGRVNSATLKEFHLHPAHFGTTMNGNRVVYWPVSLTISASYRKSNSFRMAENIGNPSPILHYGETYREVSSKCFVWWENGSWQVSYFPLDDIH